MTAPTTTEPDAAVIEPGDGGYPESPQYCQYGEHPAIKSLLFRDEDAYVPTCAEHEAEAREQLAAAGETVVGEVTIEPDTDGHDVDRTDRVASLAADPAPAELDQVEVGPDTDGEMALTFPVLVIEGHETSDGRYLNAGSLTHRALPLSLLACPESAHGGNDPDAAVVVGRIDTLTRTPGPDVVSKRTGEPFPEGSFVWSATGAMYSDVTVGKHNIGDLVRRRFLRGVSVDLAGMDVEMIGEGDALADADHPRRRMIAHAAEISAATLVPIPAFGDAYVELAGEDLPSEPVALDDLPEGLTASAFPAWRSSEVGDYPSLVASAEPWPAAVPEDAVDQLAALIADDGGEQRDASELAAAIVDYIAAQWAAGDADSALPAELAADAGALRGRWNPADHPRDRRGRWIEKGGRVTLDDGTKGTVIDDDAGDGDVRVKADNGVQVRVRGSDLDVDDDTPAPGGGDGDTGASDPAKRTAAADKVTRARGAKELKDIVDGMDDEELRAADEEMTDRAKQLGRPGAVSRGHQAVKDAIEAKGGTPAPSAPKAPAKPARKPRTDRGLTPPKSEPSRPPRLPALPADEAAPSPIEGSEAGRRAADRINISSSPRLAVKEISTADLHAADYEMRRRAIEIGGSPDRVSRAHKVIKAELKKRGEEPIVASATFAEQFPEDDDLDMPSGDEVGMPDAPQDCEFGDHPAVKSLLFDDDTKYVAVCADDEQQGRDLIEQNGAAVSREVDIKPSDTTDDTEEVPA